MSRDTKKKKQIPIFIDAKTCPYASLIAAKREKTIFFCQKENFNLNCIIMLQTQNTLLWKRNHLQFKGYFFYLQDVVDWLERHLGTCYKYLP